ncbi:cytochrome P450 [Amycolatopsis lurida]
MTDTPVTLDWQARTARPTPFDPPEIFGVLREDRPLRPMTFFDGHVGWLATGYQAVRAILADQRFSTRQDLAHPPHKLFAQDTGGDGPPPGLFIQMDPPDHTRYRRLLIGAFTVRRMKQLETRILQATQDCLDEMERTGPPVDLVGSLALPLPTVLICELLGIPADIREEFQAATVKVLSLDLSLEDRQQAYVASLGFIARLVESKRQKPTDDIYSALINGGELTDEELTVLGGLLFGAGFETTSSLLGLGAFVLLEHPDQVKALRDDPTLIDNAVEELLRYPTSPGGMLRTALEDVEIEGELIHKGQTVELLVAAANRDPARFDDPDTLDITRSAQGQLSFGHGVHQCLGQQLARVELRTVFPALFDRFPTLRLAVPAREVPMKDDALVFGVERLPVAW